MEDYDFLKKVGDKFIRLRKKAGYTSYETFANDFELQRQTVYRAEKGENITLLTLNALLRAHNMSPEEFFKGIK